MARTMAPKRTTKPNKRLIALRESLGKTQSAFADDYFRVGLTTYQRWERIAHDDLPGPVQVIIEALEAGGRIPRK